MAFKLAIANVVEIPVRFKVQDGGTTKTHAFTLIGDRLDQQQVRDLAKDDETTVKELLMQRLTGWRAQRLVLDDSDQPAPFSPEALECLLSLPGMEMVAYRGYLQALAVADTSEGREKK